MAIRVREKDVPATLIFTAIVASLFIAIPILVSNHKDKEEPYSSSSTKYDSVYVDIIYCQPKYIITDALHPSRGAQDIVCEVQTEDSNTILVAFSEYEYNSENFDGSMVLDYVDYQTNDSFFSHESYPVLSFEPPCRLHCRVNDTEKYGLENKEGKKDVLIYGSSSKSD